MIIKIHRTIRKNFGGYGNFIVWILFVSATVYVIDTLLLPRSHRPPQRIERQKFAGGVSFLLVERDSQVIADRSSENHDDNPEVPEYVKPSNLDHDRLIDNKDVEFDQDDESEPDNCGVSEPCPQGYYSYLIRSGRGRNGSAAICFDGDYLISASLKNNHRGMNVVLINEKSRNVDDIQIFDVYFTDIGLLEYMKENMRHDQIVLIASQDEASYSLKADGRKAIKELGSVLIEDVAFRDNYVIAGKRGLFPGRALEKMKSRDTGKDFADRVELKGCLALPFEQNPKMKTTRQSSRFKVGENEPKDELQKEPNVANSKAQKMEAKDSKYNAKFVEEFENCGLATKCSGDEIAMQLYTGKENKEPPKICIDGRYVLAGDLNGGGRGMNFAVVDSQSREVVRVAHFDTFGSDTVAIEMFLELLKDGELLIAVANDEASEKLTPFIRAAIEEVGSSYISLLSFRDVWAFVGQKGIRGYSPVEQFSFSDATKNHLAWPKPIDFKTCVSTTLKPLGRKQQLEWNINRRRFCKMHDGYAQFCDASVVNKYFVPPPLANIALEKHAIFEIPIILVAGLNHNAVRLQLEAVFSNPGLVTGRVRLFYDEKFGESGALAGAFGVTSVGLPSSTKYSELLQKAIRNAWELFPDSKYLIILEEEVIPTADFLNFFRQCFNSLDNDKTLIGISGWNPNGFYESSRDVNVAYRTESFPGLGFILKRSFYEEYMKNKMSECCAARSWEGWMVGKLTGMEMIIPEVSRVSRGRVDGQVPEPVREMFKQERRTVEPGQHVINDPDLYVERNYISHIVKLINQSSPLNNMGIDLCLRNKTFYFNVSQITSVAPASSYVVFFDDKSNQVLTRLCQCFKLHGSIFQPTYGRHRAVLRFNQHGKAVLLVDSMSSYYKYKPSTVKQLTVSQIVS